MFDVDRLDTLFKVGIGFGVLAATLRIYILLRLFI